MSLLGLDVGTTGCKATAFNHDGSVIASAYREYPLISPEPGWAELDSRRVWEDVKTCLGQVAAETKKDPISALAVSCQGEATTALDADGNVLDRSPVSFDTRTAGLLSWWEENVGRDRIFEITGQPVAPLFTALKLQWMKQNKPEIFSKAKKFLCYEDFVCHQLGLDPVADYTIAGRTMLFDVQKHEWSEELLDKVGLSPDHLARVAPSGEIIGKIPDKKADELGLPRGIQLVTGGHDQPCQTLGAGVIDPSVASYGIGTVECIVPTFGKPVLNRTMLDNNICCYDHVQRGLYIALVYNFTGGQLYRWYRDTFGETEKTESEKTGKDVYYILDSKASTAPTNLLVLPHFTSTGVPHFDTHSRGAILGLTLGTTKGEIIRAILEGITMELRFCVELLDKAGVPIKELRATGGGSKSDYWMQIKADIMGRPIRVPAVSEAGNLGCAILAGTATGVYSSTAEAVERLVKIDKSFEPVDNSVSYYNDRFALYMELYPKLKDLFHRM
ncbi:MAG: FGGY-family carbohydrate kinase [bacterium]